MKSASEETASPRLSRLALGGLAAICAAAILVQLAKTLYAGGTDDAFITYTFARSLAEGQGISWFPGSGPVYGSTTILYTLLLAAASALGCDIPVASTVMGALAWSGATLLMGVMLARLAPLPVVFATTLIAAVSHLHVVTTMGMETGLYAFLAMLAFWLYGRDRFVAASLTAVGAMMTRPDGVIVIGLIGLHYGLSHWPLQWWSFRRGMRLAGPFVLCLAVYALTLRGYFGMVMPNSFHAKSTFDSTVSGIFSIRTYLFNFSDFGAYFLPSGLRMPYRALVVGALLAGALFVLWRWRNRATLLFFFGGLNLAIYHLTGMPEANWYYAPSYLAGYALMLVGLYATGRAAAWAMPRFGRAALYVGAPAFGLSLTLYALTAWFTIDEDPWGRRYNERFSAFPGNDLKHATDVYATIIANRRQSSPSLMAFEVGLLSYYTRSRIYDLLGLVSPDVVQHGGSRNPLYVLERYRPDYALLTDSQAYPPTAAILQSRQFIAGYKLLWSRPRLGLGDNYILLERRQSDLEEIRRLPAPDPSSTYLLGQPLNLSDGVVCIEMTSGAAGTGRLFLNGEPPRRFLMARGRQEVCTAVPGDTAVSTLRIEPTDTITPHQAVLLERRARL